MKKFFKKIILWLPLGFVILILLDMFLLYEYFSKGRYSVVQTPAFVGLSLSLLLATIFETTNKEPKRGLRIIYKWYISIPLIILMVLLTLASMSR